MEVTECENCGGLVVFDADAAAARCVFCGGVFCGGVSQTTKTLQEATQPTQAVVFTVSAEDAHRLYCAWARRSFWAPRSLPDNVEALERVWIPAWNVRARVHATWTGLVSARTKSGKRPKAGVDVADRDVWVPGSLGLSQAELSALAPFEGEQVEWQPEHAEAPYEVGGLSSQTAISEARRQLQALVRRLLRQTEGLEDPRVSVLLDDVVAVPLMLPVWVGCFRFRDRPWRFVINGQNGRTTGRAPVDRVKVGVAIAVVAIAVVLLWLWAH